MNAFFLTRQIHRAPARLYIISLVFFLGCESHPKSNSDTFLPVLALLARPPMEKALHEWNADFTEIDVPDSCSARTSFFERTFRNQKTIAIQVDHPLNPDARLRLFHGTEEISGNQTIQGNTASLVTAPLQSDTLYNVELTEMGTILSRRFIQTMPSLPTTADFLNISPAGNDWNFVLTFSIEEQSVFHSDRDYVFADLQPFVPGSSFACELTNGNQAAAFPGIWTFQFQGNSEHANASSYNSIVLSFLPWQLDDNLTYRDSSNGGIRVFKD